MARSNIATFSDEAEALAALKAASSSDGWTSLDDDELASLAGLLARGELVLVRSALPEALEPSCPSMIPRLSDLGE